MKIADLAQCEKGLDFKPLQDWPLALPAFCWGKILLCGFSRVTGTAVDISSPDHDLAAAFSACHPHLTLSELARLHIAATHVPVAENLVSCLVSQRGWRFHTELTNLFNQIVQLPTEFQKWMSRREIAPRDLSILKSIQNVCEIHKLCLEIARLDCSKSMGCQILELASELLLMGIHWNEADQVSADQWYQALRQKRYPKAYGQDEQHQSQVQRLPWPAHVSARWIRTGDDTGLEIRMTASSQLDLSRKIEGLRNIDQLLKTPEQNPWKI